MWSIRVSPLLTVQRQALVISGENCCLESLILVRLEDREEVQMHSVPTETEADHKWTLHHQNFLEELSVLVNYSLSLCICKNWRIFLNKIWVQSRQINATNTFIFRIHKLICIKHKDYILCLKAQLTLSKEGAGRQFDWFDCDWLARCAALPVGPSDWLRALRGAELKNNSAVVECLVPPRTDYQALFTLPRNLSWKDETSTNGTAWVSCDFMERWFWWF